MEKRQVIGLEFNLFRQQSLALQCPADEICYGGAAGGGKSHLIRTALITWALAIPGLQLYMFRRKYPELVKNHLMGPSSFHALLAPLVKAGKARVIKGRIDFYNGSQIHLCHLMHTKNIYDYQGVEIHVLVMDEATHFTDAEYRYLRGRLRKVGLPVPAGINWTFPRVLLCTNPGGQGHHWVKQGFIDHGPYVIHRAAKTEGGMKRAFIPARMEDNPALLEADPEYIDRLEGLGDPMLVRAMKEGDWDVVAGAMFAQTWRKPRHVIRPFDIPVDWPIWMGADDGYLPAPACVLWFTQNPNTQRIYVIRELYRAGMLPATMAERIKDISKAILQVYPNGVRRGLQETPKGNLDSASFATTGTDAEPRGRQLQKLGIRFKPVEKWPSSRVDTCRNLHRLLAPLMVERGGKQVPLDGMPGIQFFDNCTNIIRTLPALSRDDSDPEDVDTTEEDHPYDALRYGLQWKSKKIKRTRVGGT